MSFEPDIDDIEMRLLPLFSILCLASRCADCRSVDADPTENENSVGKHRRKFTVDELLNTKFPHGISDDVDVDVCKAGKRRTSKSRRTDVTFFTNPINKQICVFANTIKWEIEIKNRKK